MSLQGVIAEISEYRRWDCVCYTRKNKYGYVTLSNPHYGSDYAEEVFDDYGEEYIFRKPTPAERREIVINTIIECNGRSFRIQKLAKYLAVSDRTIQYLLKSLKKEGLIEVVPRFDSNGVQISNTYKYIGPPCEFYGSGLNLKLLYDKKQNVGFRSWNWKKISFPHNGVWYDQYKQMQMKFDVRIDRRNYLVTNGLPLIIPDDVKYLVIRYTYWKGKDTASPDSKTFDSTIRIPLNVQYHKERIGSCNLLFWVCGTKNNPKVKIYDLDYGEKVNTFTWFTENISESETKLDNNQIEQLLLMGDFTTK